MPFEKEKELLAALAKARDEGRPASDVTGCPCDFCTGKKKHEDNWCARCAAVKMPPPKWWENMDICDQCEVEVKNNNGKDEVF